MLGSVSSVDPVGGWYGLVNKADNAIPTIIAANTNTGASTATRGTRRSGRTHPSIKYHKSTATTPSAAAASNHGYPGTKIGRPATLLRLSAAAGDVRRARISSSVSHTMLDLWRVLPDTPSRVRQSFGRHVLRSNTPPLEKAYHGVNVDLRVLPHRGGEADLHAILRLTVTQARSGT